MVNYAARNAGHKSEEENTKYYNPAYRWVIYNKGYDAADKSGNDDDGNRYIL